ncbi:MAG: hypothetical protein Greene071436_347 [Parcubacteria group bacterium Greene0714_36]|nr:MAG: hypothetical protein Greene071436_347 [Parcubacteria group bacterium Greene0714_36]
MHFVNADIVRAFYLQAVISHSAFNEREWIVVKVHFQNLAVIKMKKKSIQTHHPFCLPSRDTQDACMGLKKSKNRERGNFALLNEKIQVFGKPMAEMKLGKSRSPRKVIAICKILLPGNGVQHRPLMWS